MLITKTVKLKWQKKYKKYYTEKGYIFTKFGDEFEVNIADLKETSHAIVETLCDYCLENDIETYISKEYREYIKQNKNSIVQKDCCFACKGKKTAESNKIIYGVENVFQLETIKQKSRDTCQEKYGVDHAMKNADVRNSVEETNIIRYGGIAPVYSDKVKSKMKNTNEEKYGVPFYFQTNEFKIKYKETCLKNWGVESPSQNEEIKAKVAKSYYKHGSCPTSFQQLEIYNILKENNYNVELNYPLSNINLDVAIFIGEIKIDLEYDAWKWHQDKKADRRRDEFTKSQGWKVLRIRSGHKLPTLEQLEEAIDKLLNTGRAFTQIVLDDWEDKVVS